MVIYGPNAPVGIFQHESEFKQLLNLYKKLKPKKVLEIGSYHGGTLYHWLQNAKDSIVVSIDSHIAGIDNTHLYRGWCPAGVQVHSIKGNSHDKSVQTLAASYGPFDFAFIDGGHWYKEVKADWLDYKTMMSDHGIMAFHDILPGNKEAHPDIEVSQLWAEIKQDYKTDEFVESYDALWGGIGVVYL